VSDRVSTLLPTAFPEGSVNVDKRFSRYGDQSIMSVFNGASMRVLLWFPANSATGISLEFEAGWIER